MRKFGTFLFCILVWSVLLTGCGASRPASKGGFGGYVDPSETEAVTTMGDLQDRTRQTTEKRYQRQTEPKSDWEKYEQNQNDGYNGSYGVIQDDTSHVYNEYDGMNFGNSWD